MSSALNVRNFSLLKPIIGYKVSPSDLTEKKVENEQFLSHSFCSLVNLEQKIG
jgi:hypothetical protein